MINRSQARLNVVLTRAKHKRQYTRSIEHFENRSVTLELCPDIEKNPLSESRERTQKHLNITSLITDHFFKLEYLYIWNNVGNLTHPVKILSLGAKHYGTTAPN